MSALHEWLGARADGVPETLSLELAKCLSTKAPSESSPIHALSTVVFAQMELMRTRTCVAREDALALLATDALVTYLLELAATQRVVNVETFAGDILRTIVGTAASPPVSALSA